MSGLDFVAPIFVPANRPERFAKAAGSGADAVVIDLEDAVDPSEREAARACLAADFASVPVIVRVNAIGTRWHAADVAAALALPVAAIMLPKAEWGTELVALAERIVGAGKGFVALVETARGIADVRRMAEQGGIGRFAFGSIDFCADVGCLHTRDALAPARSEMVLASRLGGMVAPLDGVTTAIVDAAVVEDDARHGRELGFGGKLCIHPRQIAPVLAGFRPSAAEFDWAENVLASGEGAAAVDGEMVDAPVRARARAILARRTT